MNSKNSYKDLWNLAGGALICGFSVKPYTVFRWLLRGSRVSEACFQNRWIIFGFVSQSLSSTTSMTEFAYGLAAMGWGHCRRCRSDLTLISVSGFRLGLTVYTTAGRVQFICGTNWLSLRLGYPSAVKSKTYKDKFEFSLQFGKNIVFFKVRYINSIFRKCGALAKINKNQKLYWGKNQGKKTETELLCLWPTNFYLTVDFFYICN